MGAIHDFNTNRTKLTFTFRVYQKRQKSKSNAAGGGWGVQKEAIANVGARIGVAFWKDGDKDVVRCVYATIFLKHTVLRWSCRLHLDKMLRKMTYLPSRQMPDELFSLFLYTMDKTTVKHESSHKMIYAK